MNNVILIGRLTKDPEVSFTSNTNTVKATFTLAVDRQSSEDKQADFIRITVWGKQAEICERYLFKGKQIAIEGRIQTGSYENKEGQRIYTTDVIARRVEFLGSLREQEAQETPRQEIPRQEMPIQAPDRQTSFSEIDEELPF